MTIKSIFAAAVAVILLPVLAYAGIVDRKAPDFKLMDLEGRAVSLSDFQGKVVFLDFWASWCPPCKKEIPELTGLAKRFGNKDLAVVAVSVDKKKEHAGAFISSVPGASTSLVVLHDQLSSVISQYMAQAMPTSFIIDRAGVIRFVHFGYREQDPGTWVTEIEGLLKKGKEGL